jgi:hypothetical protein
MRTKFEQPRIPSTQEMRFIRFISGTGDEYGLSELILSLDNYVGASPRKLRKFKERYNCMKYIDIVPKGRIHNIRGVYKLVRSNSKYHKHYRLKAKFNKICGLLDDHWASITMGDIQANGQISFDNELYDEQSLIELAMEYEELLKMEVE